MPHLRIELLSPMAVGTGAGRPGVVDREVAVDEWGFPYLPGRRWKGLLREAFQQIAHYFPGEFPPEESVFGNAGHQQGAIAVGNARAEHWKELKDLAVRHKKFISREQVTEAYTDIRRQTRIADDTGAAMGDMLRFTRVLRKGLVFTAECTAPAEYLHAIALAAAHVRASGHSRTCGLGEVKVRLIGDQGEPLTDHALAKFSTSQPWASPSTNAATQALTAGAPTGEATHVMNYTLELREPALLPDHTGDPNTVLTREVVPGSTIHGVIAGHWLRKHGVDESFNRIFCSGQVRFLAAAPTVFDGRRSIRTLPVPQSFREKKSVKDYFDLVTQGDKKPDPSRRIGQAYARWDMLWDSPGAPRAAVNTSLSYHHLRAEDRRLQRAVGDDSPILDTGNPGTLFVYEHIEPGQFFAGAILGSEADLQTLRELIPDNSALHIGRSKSAQYGGNTLIRWEAPMRIAGQETSGWSGANPTEVRTKAVIVTLMSPLLGRTPSGNPAAVFPLAALEKALGGIACTIDKEFARVECAGGFLSHQKMPRTHWPALQPGSVFVLRRKDGGEFTIDGQKWCEAGARSYGARIEEGFGRIALSTFEEFAGQGDPPKRVAGFTPSPCRPAPRGQAQMTEPVSKFARALFQSAIEKKVALQAQTFVEQLGVRAPLRPSLLYRLSGLAERSSWQDFGTVLEKLRKPAIRQLDAARVKPDSGGVQDMHTFLKDFHKGWEAWVVQIALDLHQHWRELLPRNPVVENGRLAESYRKQGEALARRFLLILFGGVAGLQRSARRRSRRSEQTPALEVAHD